jgi:flagellar L-ring protein precursor FlgH
MHKLSTWSILGAALLAAGCANNIPSTNIQQPMTARPVEQKATFTGDGAIFRAGHNERPLFEDVRARNVGDIITINIVESANVADSSANSASQAGSFSMATPTITGGAAAKTLVNPYTAAGSATGSTGSKSANGGSNAFTGNITATVIEVLANGNLLVSGEKQIAVNPVNEFIRFSGVVTPITISNNTVQSTQVADVHIEYKGANDIDKAAVMSMLGRIFLSVMPF